MNQNHRLPDMLYMEVFEASKYNKWCRRPCLYPDIRILSRWWWTVTTLDRKINRCWVVDRFCMKILHELELSWVYLVGNMINKFMLFLMPKLSSIGCNIYPAVLFLFLKHSSPWQNCYILYQICYQDKQARALVCLHSFYQGGLFLSN